MARLGVSWLRFGVDEIEVGRERKIKGAS